MSSNPEFGPTTTGIDVANAFPELIRGRTFLITGVSPGGIGASTAEALYSQSPKCLILTGRQKSRTEAVIADVRQRFPQSTTHIEFLELDLASNKSVRTAAQSVLANTQISAIDVLINNAGVMQLPERLLSEDGVEYHFASNHVGHFLFTTLIIPKIVAAASQSARGATRIVNISSAGHMFGPVRFSDINFTKPQLELPQDEQANLKALESWGHDVRDSYVPRAAYAQSKTANILYSVELTKRLASKYGIYSFSLHPGAVGTEIWRHEEGSMARTIGIAREQSIHWKNLEEGCSTTLVAALDPKLPALSETAKAGIYLEDCQLKPARASWAQDENGAVRLWELSEKLIGQVVSV